MAATYEPIATTTLGSAASSITFSTIPGTYTDLVLTLVYLRDTSGSAYPIMRFNSDTGSNYSGTRLTGDGSSAASARQTNQTSISIDGEYGSSTTVPGLGIVHIFSYAGSTNKTVLGETSMDKNGSGGVIRRVSLWRNTAAITSITILEAVSGNFAAGTTATLYGILKA